MSRRHTGSLNPPPARDPLKDAPASAAITHGDERDQAFDRVDEDETTPFERDNAAMQTLALELFSIDQQLRAEGHSLASLLSKLAGSQFGVYPVAQPYSDNVEED